MKKIIGLLSFAGILVVMGCGNNKPAEVKKETIVVPAPVTIIREEPKTTTVTLDKKGIQVETKKVKVGVKNN